MKITLSVERRSDGRFRYRPRPWRRSSTASGWRRRCARAWPPTRPPSASAPATPPGSSRSWSARTRPPQVYVRNKIKACEEAGMASFHEPMPATSTQAEVLAMVDRYNADDRVDGILVQSPLPKGLDFKQVLERIDPAKDVDGFHPLNVGRLVAGQPGIVACTPAGRDGAARRVGDAARGRRRRRRRPLRHRRQAGRAAPAAPQRHGHDLPLAHARPARGHPPRRRARRRGRPAAHDHGRHGEARGDRHRRRHQPHRHGPRRRRRLRLRSSRSRARSRRCPAASAR